MPQPNDGDPEPQELFPVLDAFLENLHDGRRPDRQAILAQHPELAFALECLEVLEGWAPPVPTNIEGQAQGEECRATVDWRDDNSDPEPLRCASTLTGSAAAPASDRSKDATFKEGRVRATLPDSSESGAHVSLRAADFGQYQLLDAIGRGGMGVVYRARQVGLNRTVALKMILAGRLAGPEEVQRFRAEAPTAARLQHPNIVAIYEVGEHGGQHFFSMEYVSGDSLAKRTAAGAVPGRLAARYLEQVARGLHYAHQRGVLHRDLKPANILLDEQDQPKITDFGLAKVLGPAHGLALDTSCQLTHTGELIGTPSYMAPEQASGRAKEVGPACDVYGLGAVLYELLTGRPPFKAESPLETILQVIDQDPVPPRLLNRNVDADLETICLKCLEKDPGARYASAEAVAEDLRRYLEGEPITARSINLLERLSRTVIRSRHDKELHNWGLGLTLSAIIIFLCHSTTYVLLEMGKPPAICHWVPRAVEFTLLGLVLWRGRRRSLWPTNAAERLIWAVWIGYLVAYLSVSLVYYEQGRDHLETYAAAAVLSGLAFFAMGCHLWGWNYVTALAFMGLAPVLARYPRSSPLWFGTLWGLGLPIGSMRYWRMGSSSAAPPSDPSLD